MRTIGFSLAVQFRIRDVYTKENIDSLKNTGAVAIESGFHERSDIDMFEKLIPSFEGFRYVSMHLPTDARFKDDDETEVFLGRVSDMYKRMGAQLAVVHPDTVDDWNVFKKFDLNWAAENMDDLKDTYKDVESFRKFFAGHDEWNMVLDLGHCVIIDPTMRLADDMINNFGDRIREFHLSGYETLHDPLYRTRQSEVIRYCNRLDIPIIIESIMDIEDGEAGLEKEFRYIMENLG